MNNSENITLKLPNWELIDEVSLPLLEQGIARFETLQALLPSLLSVDPLSLSSDQKEKLPKLLRIAQMQIEHALKSQSQLVAELETKQTELALRKKEIRCLKAKLEKDENQELYKCWACSKFFLTQEFLSGHIEKRHSSK